MKKRLHRGSVLPSRGSNSSSVPLALAVACASVLANTSVHAAAIFWDGSGTSWNDVVSWSQAADAAEPNPAAVPGAADVATFVSSTAVAAQNVNLDGPQSVLGLETTPANLFLTTLRAGGTNTILNLGTGGINHVGGAITIGSTTSGQQVAISLQGAQTWTSSTVSGSPGAVAIMVLNGVSIGAGGNQKLTLTGTNTGSRISGVVSDGAGVLSIEKAGATVASVWTLAGANTYTGLTSITGGSLRVENNLALGSTIAGTEVANNGTLQLANNVTVTGEPLSLLGGGASTGGALRNISGTNTWAGDITIQSGVSVTRIASDAGNLRITGNVALSATAADQLALQGAGNGEISGVISGISRVTKGATGGGTWTLSGANTYAGKTTITNGTLAASTLNSVVGGTPSSNLGTPTTVANGTIDLGGGTVTGTLRYTGPGETTDRVVNLPGSSGGGVIDQSGTGVLQFTSNTTAAATGKTLTLQGSTAGTGLFSGVIGGASVSLAKAGTSSWRVTAVNTYGGTTNVNGGTLIADLSLNTGGVLPATTTITTGGGTLQVLGASTGVSSQTVAGITSIAGPSRIVINPNGGTSTTLTIASTAVSVAPNSRVTFDYTQGTTNGGTIGNNIVAWNADLTGGIISPSYFVTDVGGFGFATVVGGNVVRLVSAPGLPQSGAVSTQNYILNSNTSSTTPGSLNLTQTASQSVNTLTIDTAATSGTLNLGNTVLTTNTFLVTGLTTNTFAISGGASGGILVPNAAGTLLLEHHAAGTFTIGAPILDNGGSGFTNNGTGTTVLSGANTYTGPTVLNSGTTRFAGSMAAGTVTINSNAIAQIGSATGLTALNSVAFGPSTNGRLQLTGNSTTITTLTNDVVIGSPVVENDSPSPATLTLTPSSNAAYAGIFQDGGGGGALGVTLTVSAFDATFGLTGANANTHTGLTTVNGFGLVELGKTGGNAIGGSLTVSNGGRLRFTQSNQIADTASVTLSGIGSSFNGSAVNTGTFALNETFANLAITGGGFTTGAGATGFVVTGATSITGGAENTVFVGNSGAQFATNSLSLIDMPATAGGLVDTANSFTLYGNSTTARSRLAVGSGGLQLNSSVLNLRRGGAGAMGSRLVLDGDVTTAGTFPSRINLDTAGGTTGAVSIDLSSTAGDVERTFNSAGGGSDLSVGVPIVNGAATTASIAKSGPGTLTISSVSTYNGSTNVKEGTLIVTGSAAGSSAFVGNTASPATATILRGGNGSVSATPTLRDINAVTAGAIVDPGNSPVSTGILNTNTFSLTNSARLAIQIGGVFAGGNGTDGYDQINVLSPTASASVSGGFLDLTDITFSPLPSDALLFLLVNNGTDAPSGLFSGVTLGGVPVANLNNIVIGGQQFALVNNANFDGVTGLYGGLPDGGNDIALVAVPEPTCVASLLGAVAVLGLRRRRSAHRS